MGTQKKRVLAAVFDTPETARNVVRGLRGAGYSEDEIGFLSHDDRGQPELATFADLEQNKAARGAAVGAVAGAGSGALWAIGVAVGLLPAIGPVIAGGLLAALAASTGIGAAAGAVAGGLVGLGLTDEEAAYFDEEFRGGHTIIVVQTAQNPDLAYRILNERKVPASYLRDPLGLSVEAQRQA